MCSKAVLLVILVASFLTFSEVAQAIQIPRKSNFLGPHFSSLPNIPPRGTVPGRASTPSIFCGRNQQCSCNGCKHGVNFPVEDKVEP
ncbi:hypothetical protein QJS10_CPB21g00165 [Acorus calamus]|uniref:Uncharacterized protein n=1 Tax=Acorus calamus TaxID=4465 RepID=A0AAV9C304_ACOCL|nr:hypothetical protein QJS10_CPB21g00165 [Acorus calamus]